MSFRLKNVAKQPAPTLRRSFERRNLFTVIAMIYILKNGSGT